MTTIAMNNLWTYLQGLSLSSRNQVWLAERLMEASYKSRKTKAAGKKKSTAAIPEEFRCNPYETSPSGDPFFADKRNVEYIRQRSEDWRTGKTQGTATIHGHQELDQFLDSL